MARRWPVEFYAGNSLGKEEQDALGADNRIAPSGTQGHFQWTLAPFPFNLVSASRQPT